MREEGKTTRHKWVCIGERGGQRQVAIVLSGKSSSDGHLVGKWVASPPPFPPESGLITDARMSREMLPPPSLTEKENFS